MMKESQAIGTVGAVPARGSRASDWQRWAPTAAVAWSLIYAALGSPGRRAEAGSLTPPKPCRGVWGRCLGGSGLARPGQS